MSDWENCFISERFSFREFKFDAFYENSLNNFSHEQISNQENATRSFEWLMMDALKKIWEFVEWLFAFLPLSLT